MASLPTSIVTGPDGALWFTTDSNEAGRITTGGMITLYPVAVSGNGNGVGGIIAGPDGNLWFPVDNQLGEINTAGHIREFPVKISNNSLTDLAVGPNGTIWGLDLPQKIAQITMAK